MKKKATTDLFRDYYCLYAQKRLDQSTIDLTDLAFRRFVDFAGDVDIDSISLDDCELYLSYLVDVGCAKRTANNYVKAVGRVFNWAVEHGRIESNPFERVGFFKIPQKPAKVYTVSELQSLLVAASGDEVMQAYIWLGINTLRKGEVMNLTRADIDFENDVIKIQPKYRTAGTWDWQPKNRKLRYVPMISVVKKILLDRIKDLPAYQPYVNLSPRRYGYMLARMDELTERQKKKPFQNFDRNFRRLRSRVFVDGDYHQLRRTGLTMMLEEGEAPHVVQVIAGHSNIKTTQRYIGWKDSYLSGALGSINRAVSSVG